MAVLTKELRVIGLMSDARPEQLDNTLARLKWREALTDADCRSMATEYLRGIREPENIDAYAEYEHRWGTHNKKNKKGLNQSPSSKRRSK
jgi:hypothetical protein